MSLKWRTDRLQNRQKQKEAGREGERPAWAEARPPARPSLCTGTHFPQRPRDTPWRQWQGWGQAVGGTHTSVMPTERSAASHADTHQQAPRLPSSLGTERAPDRDYGVRVVADAGEGGRSPEK